MARTSVHVPVLKELKVRPLALHGVEGILGRYNDALFQPALPSSADPTALDQQQTLIFFGGDIQNFYYLMDQTDKAIDYRKWCLEAAAVHLAKAFPSKHVLIIKPSRIVFDHISCFDNFVESNYLGMPKHLYRYQGLRHLEKLLVTISSALRQMDSEVLFKLLLRSEAEEILLEKHDIQNVTVRQYENMTGTKKRVLINWQKKLQLQTYPLSLVAFSKGCVVLNQFLYEFYFLKTLHPEQHPNSCLIDRIEHMYWLDSGNCGKKNVYVSSTGILRTLASLKIKVHVHVSMYMAEDANRPWIRKQLDDFIIALSSAGNNDALKFRHDSLTKDLESHLRVLVHFKRVENKHENKMNTPQVRRLLKLPPVLEAPAPPAPRPIRARRRKRHRSTGLRLVNLHNSPYLGLQMVLRKPYSPFNATHSRIYCPPRPPRVQIVPFNKCSTMSASKIHPDKRSKSARTPSHVQPTATAPTPSTPAEPSMTAQTPKTPAQKLPSYAVWAYDMLPKNHNKNTLLLVNDLKYTSKSKMETKNYIERSYYESFAPVVVLPDSRHPKRLRVYSLENKTYVPKVYNHHYVVNRKNERKGGDDADGLDPAASDTNNATSDHNTTRSDTSDPLPDASGTGLTPPSVGSDISSSDSYISDSSGISSDSYTTDLTSASDSLSDLDLTLTGSSVMDAVSGIHNSLLATGSGAATSSSRLSGLHSTSTIQRRSNTAANQTLVSQRATPRIASNRVDTPRDPIDPPSASLVPSSQDPGVPRAGTSRVRARDVDGEHPCRYNLRKRIKRSYNEDILHIQYQ